MNSSSVYVVIFLLIGVIFGQYCPEDGSKVTAVAISEAIAIGGIAISTATATALADFQNGLCDQNVNAAANSFALAVGSGSFAESQAAASAFSDAAGHDVTAAANAAALAFQGKAEAEARAIAKTLGAASGLYGGATAQASADAFAKAVGDGHLGGQAAAKAFADAYASANTFGGGYAFVTATAKAAAEAYCAAFYQVLADAYTFTFGVGAYGGMTDAIADAESAADCYGGCCVCTEGC
eukprot:TRINITY_DN390_c0_g1_i1.p1 TRINITY_DN390_c0_g1~~TRINITY_DN390_c0_g1_i1.p1  ORF type:complete len:239 (-),score=68.26 TRINITY_DN390_c0_g1_i1:339-1055(-)